MEASPNVHIENLSRRERIRIAGVQTVVAALKEQTVIPEPVMPPVDAPTVLERTEVAHGWRVSLEDMRTPHSQLSYE